MLSEVRDEISFYPFLNVNGATKTSTVAPLKFMNG